MTMIAWPMLVSVGTGAMMVLAAAVIVHGMWGLVAVFVLKS